MRDEGIAEILRRTETLLEKMETIMLDTSRLLAAVAEEKTETASLRALAVAQTQAMKDLSAQLAAAIAANDPAAIAQVQADMDTATNDLSIDSQATKDAVTANTPAAPPA